MIETERLKLYAASRAQMEAFIASQNYDELKAAYTEMLEGCLAHPGQWEWYAVWMVERKDGTHVGELCFKGLDANGSAEIGYGVQPEYEGCGYATEAVAAAVGWALRQPGVNCVTAETDRDNLASQRVLEKCGFVTTGETGAEGPVFCRRR